MASWINSFMQPLLFSYRFKENTTDKILAYLQQQINGALAEQMAIYPVIYAKKIHNATPVASAKIETILVKRFQKYPKKQPLTKSRSELNGSKTESA